MKFVSYSLKRNSMPSSTLDRSGIGIVQGDRVLDISHTNVPFGPQMDVLGARFTAKHSQDYVAEWSKPFEEMELEVAQRSAIVSLSDVYLYPPLKPNSLRDFYAFEQHVKSARARRGLEMIPEWYELPVFYYSNPQMIYGPNYTVHKPHKTECLDFELEVAAIISPSSITGVQDTAVEEAESHIVGYTIMNDWSARDIQRKEMAVGLGPAKGKDFATSLGPWIVTPDELEDRRSGKGYDLQMVARRNGVEISRGNWNTIYWSFAEMIARASEDCMLFPGDVIGSGTVGTGCILELGSENVGGWLQPGDVIELEIERLGVLRNTIGEPSKSRM
jgi:fumarylacetoacetate (FAA) hydrolase